MADTIITMFVFSADNPVEVVSRFADVIQWRNEHDGQWPTLPTESDPRSGTLNGLVNVRSEPRAAPETMVASLTPETAPMPFEIIGEQNGYYKVAVWMYVPRLTVIDK